MDVVHVVGVTIDKNGLEIVGASNTVAVVAV